MFNQLLKQMTSAFDPQSHEKTLAPLDAERVSAVLLVEIARSDHEISLDERQTIKKALSASTTLSEAELDDLIGEAFSNVDNTLSLYEHVKLINDSFGKEDKLALVEQMWRVAYADGNVDGYEEYTIRKLCDLLYVRHRDYIQAKLKVAEEI